ncbi:MAG: hypothetical protein EPN91_08070 [Salinibacterium sp.]|nr:MAG: hypothetical protein EPN91_08070 [Salinibacterium sp.]
MEEIALYNAIPDAEIIRQAGGLVCEWSNGLPIYDDSARSEGSVGVSVEYLPFAASGYWRWVVGDPALDPPETFNCLPDSCILASSIGGDYLMVTIEGAISDAVAERLAHEIRVALQLGQKTPFVPPHYAAELDHTCDQIVRPVVWRAAVQTSTTLTTWPVDGWEWRLTASARAAVRAPGCEYSDLFDRYGAGALFTLPGGRWAFRHLRPLLTSPGALTPITVPGMQAGDTAYTRCDSSHTSCILDALIATHWVQVHLPGPRREDGGDLIRRDRLAAMSPILSEIVLQIYSP